MPNTDSAKKRMRSSAKQRLANKSIKSVISSTRRKMFESLAANDVEASKKNFSTYCSVLDKASKKGVINKNTAIRRKRRSAKHLATMSAD
ncbi:MAG: 30S ribosomal protein S20 [Lentisphaerae bacterium]|nr:30S ribosomal protein S20 [Lentisphaerota bacterium]